MTDLLLTVELINVLHFKRATSNVFAMFNQDQIQVKY